MRCVNSLRTQILACGNNLAEILNKVSNRGRSQNSGRKNKIRKQQPKVLSTPYFFCNDSFREEVRKIIDGNNVEQQDKGEERSGCHTSATSGQTEDPEPKFIEAQAAGRSLYGIDQYITNFSVMPDESILIPRGMRPWLLSQCESLGEEFTLTDNRKAFDFKHINSTRIRYRPYQIKAVMELIGKGR